MLRGLDYRSLIWFRFAEPSLIIAKATQHLAFDPCRETSHQLLIHDYGASGNKDEAARKYPGLPKTMAAESGVRYRSLNQDPSCLLKYPTRSCFKL